MFAVEKNTNVTVSGLTITGGTGLAVHGARHLNDNEGGGILNFGTLTISSCTISGNCCDPASGKSYGGGIYNAGTLTVTTAPSPATSPILTLMASVKYLVRPAMAAAFTTPGR